MLKSIFFIRSFSPHFLPTLLKTGCQAKANRRQIKRSGGKKTQKNFRPKNLTSYIPYWISTISPVKNYYKSISIHPTRCRRLASPLTLATLNRQIIGLETLLFYRLWSNRHPMWPTWQTMINYCILALFNDSLTPIVVWGVSISMNNYTELPPKCSGTFL